MADSIDWTLVRPQSQFVLPTQNPGQQFVAAAQTGSNIGLQGSQAALNRAQVPLTQAQTASTMAEVPLKQAQTQSTLAEVPLKAAQTQSTLADVPLKGAQTQSYLADVPYKNALTQQAIEASKMTAVTTAVAKAGLQNDIMSAVGDDKTYNYAKNSLQELGIDTSGMPDQYDPDYVAQRQATSSHYLDLMKAQAEIAMKQIGYNLQTGQLNMDMMSKGLPPMYGQQAVQGMNMPSFGQGNPAQVPGQLAGGQGMSQQGQQQPFNGQGVAVQPQQVPMQQQSPQSMGQPQGNSGILGPTSFPAYLAQQQKLGEQSAQNISDMDNSMAKQVINAPAMLENIGTIRDAMSKGIQTGKWTGPLRELLTSSAAQELDKGNAQLFNNTLQSFAGTGVGRIMQSEVQTIKKGLPQNATAMDVNNKILAITEAGIKLGQAQNQGYQQLRQQGYTDTAQIQGILTQAAINTGVFNSKTGKVSLDNLKNYPQALNAATNNKPMIDDDAIAQTAQAHGQTPDQVRAVLKAQGLLD